MDNIQRHGSRPVVGLIMGSTSDWDTMQHAAKTLEELGISYEKAAISAHRTPERAHEYATSARERGLKIIIAAAGGAAHLAGVMAAHTTLPVLGVPVKGWALDGLDSLLSTVNMPGGIPVLTLSIGKAGAINAALAAGEILALSDDAIAEKVQAHREKQKERVLAARLPD